MTVLGVIRLKPLVWSAGRGKLSIWKWGYTQTSMYKFDFDSCQASVTPVCSRNPKTFCRNKCCFLETAKLNSCTWKQGVIFRRYNSWELRVRFIPVKKLKLLKLDLRNLSVSCIERIEIIVTVFPKIFLPADPIRFRKITTDPHALADVNRVSGWKVSKIKHLFPKTDFRKPRIHVSSVRNNTLYYLIYDIFVNCIWVGSRWR
jgi:hypothetical protein